MEKLCTGRNRNIREWSVPPVAPSGGVCLSVSTGSAPRTPSCPPALCGECQSPTRQVCLLCGSKGGKKLQHTGYALLYSFLKTEKDRERFLWDKRLLCLHKTSPTGHTRSCWSAQLSLSPAQGSWTFSGDLRAQPIPWHQQP